MVCQKLMNRRMKTILRKDAIYRQMKHYSRENNRNLAKIEELERRRNTCEAGLAALEACWMQLISTIRSVVKSDDLGPVEVQTKDIYDLTSHVSHDPDPHYVEELRNKMHATERLVTSFVRLGGKQESLLLQDEAYRQCHKAQAESSTLRSEVSLLNAKLRDSELEKQRYHEQLIAVERRLDRLKSKAAVVLNPDSEHITQPSGPAITEPPEKSAPEHVQDSVPPVSSSLSPRSPIASGNSPIGPDKPEDSTPDTSQSIHKLLQENATLEHEIAELQLQLKHKFASEMVVRSHGLFISLQKHASALEHTIKERDLRIASLVGEVNSLRRSRVDMERSFNSANEKKGEELRTLISNKDKDIARLREQRDQQLCDLNEYKQKLSVKQQSLQEFKTLAETRSERVKTLMLEVNRLRTRTAAQAGDEDLLKFLFQCGTEEQSYIEDLKTRLADAELRAKAADELKDVDVRRELINATKQLQRYQAVYGESLLEQHLDVRALAQQLQAKEEEIQKLRLQDQQREQAETSLYTEIDRLSAAWETLDKQAKSKVFDLSAMEDRLNKLGIEPNPTTSIILSCVTRRRWNSRRRPSLVISKNRYKLSNDCLRRRETHQILPDGNGTCHPS
ncbi:hypothetical protein BDW22DRAFT_244091 [Trametopsis cervina]|nr:hypothetical protein BDW22DRAFT_244091 [Trametopsis cervina]